MTKKKQKPGHAKSSREHGSKRYPVKRKTAKLDGDCIAVIASHLNKSDLKSLSRVDKAVRQLVVCSKYLRF